MGTPIVSLLNNSKMKYLKLIFTLTVLFYYNLNAQTNTICLVKYKDLKSKVVLGSHNYFFCQDKLISTKQPNLRAIHMRGFPVLINGNMTTQTDTVKYNYEFNEYIGEMQVDMSRKPESIKMKYYNSDTSKMTYYNDYNKKKYIVFDTLQKMDSWEILSDTLTFMGYKCQKAEIYYKQDKYTALFTTQLAYNAGPDAFRGLPGLILKVYNTSGNLGYKAIEIQMPYKGTIPTFNDEGEVINHVDWLMLIRERNKKMKESMNNIIDEYKKQAAPSKQ